MINDGDSCVCVDTATLGAECYGHLYFSEENWVLGVGGGESEGHVEQPSDWHEGQREERRPRH